MNLADAVGAGLARDQLARRAALLRRAFSGHINSACIVSAADREVARHFS